MDILHRNQLMANCFLESNWSVRELWTIVAQVICFVRQPSGLGKLSGFPCFSPSHGWRVRLITCQQEAMDLCHCLLWADYTIVSPWTLIELPLSGLWTSLYITTRCIAPNIDGILPKGTYPPCLRMADRALLAGYPMCTSLNTRTLTYYV